MITEDELANLAYAALGPVFCVMTKALHTTAPFGEAIAKGPGVSVLVLCETEEKARDMLAAALRGIAKERKL